MKTTKNINENTIVHYKHTHTNHTHIDTRKWNMSTRKFMAQQQIMLIEENLCFQKSGQIEEFLFNFSMSISDILW